MRLLILLVSVSITFAKDFLSAIKELDAAEEAVGSAPWFEMDQICNPTPCKLGLKCKDKDKCCDPGDWECCGKGVDGLSKREFCPSESPWNVMCNNGRCEKLEEDCGPEGVKYAGRTCSCNPTKCQFGLTCTDGTCCGKDKWDCCGTGDAKYDKRLFCPVGQIMCNNGFCVDAEDKCDSKGGVRIPKDLCHVTEGGPCSFAPCKGGMTCFVPKTGKFACCKDGDLNCCGKERENRFFCPKHLAMCMDFACLETNSGCKDKSAKHGGLRYSRQMCPGGLEQVEVEESVSEEFEEEFELLWDDKVKRHHGIFGVEGILGLAVIIFVLVTLSQYVRKGNVLDQTTEPLIRNQ